MIGRRPPPAEGEQDETLRGFDDFDLRIGDVMRGERATLGKSLLDVQRELKIKATYIAAIENADVSAFETTGFIAGYVRSYARYLGLDPDWTFDAFCAEAEFTPLTGVDKVTPTGVPGRVKGPVFRRNPPATLSEAERDPIVQPRVSFLPKEQSAFSRLEPRAIGSTLVLLALIGAIGYGGWSVLQEVQRVTVAPVERVPTAVAQVDPLNDAFFEEGAPNGSGVSAATPDALAELYRPQTLESPVMTSRDGPIASINPEQIGALAGSGTPFDAPTRPAGLFDTTVAAAGTAGAPVQDGLTDALTVALGGLVDEGSVPTVRVTADAPEVLLVAVRPAWVRVRAADGTVLFERTMSPGDSWIVPQSEVPPTLRTGAAGAVFFAVNGETYGPAGPNGAVVDQIALSSVSLSTEFARAIATESEAAREAVAYAEAALTAQTEPPSPSGADAADQ